MDILQALFTKMGHLANPNKSFSLILFPTILLVCGKVNFTNLSRYSPLSEKSYRRHYTQPFDFLHLNSLLIAESIPTHHTLIGGMDCSFIAKSGKKT